MRIRPLAALSIAVLSALALAGCAGGGDSAATSPVATAAPADLCGAVSPSGDAVEAVTVQGEVGQAPTATFTAPLAVTAVESLVETEGSGAALAAGDYVSLAYTAYDASTGDLLESAGYADDAQVVQTSPDTPLGSLLGCAPVGSRVVAAYPGDATAPAQVYVFDVLAASAKDPSCPIVTTQDPFATVTVTDGTPVIGIPAADPPSDVQIEVIDKGDGATVQAGDTVEVDYLGVKWSDGTEFDSSYGRGESASFPTDGVVTGFRRGLEGQTVGTTLLVSMSPACGYGVAGSNDNALAGETLVFYVDILSTAAQ